MQLARITTSSQKMGGVPCIRSLRIPVTTVVDMFAEGMRDQEILQALPDLEAEDIKEALQYAANTLRVNLETQGLKELVQQTVQETMHEVLRKEKLTFHPLEDYESREKKLIDLRQKITEGIEDVQRGEVVDGELVFQQLQEKLDRMRQS